MATIKGFEYFADGETYTATIETNTQCLKPVSDFYLKAYLDAVIESIEFTARSRVCVYDSAEDLEEGLDYLEKCAAGLLGIIATIKHHKGL